MDIEHICQQLQPIADKAGYPLWQVHMRFEYKVTDYLKRDSDNGLWVDHTRPIPQYKRALKVFNEYANRKGDE